MWTQFFTRLLKDEPADIQEALYSIFPQLDQEVSLLWPKWVRAFGVTYKNNNAYVITDSDRLDIIVIGGILLCSMFTCAKYCILITTIMAMYLK